MQHSDGSFFGRRKGKTLRPAQREAIERLLPVLLLDVGVPPPAQLETLFPDPVGEIRLEIGFGGGEHLLHAARSAPQAGFIGVEPFENGMAKVLAAIQREDIRNIRLFDRDAVLLLDWLPPGALARIDLLFPDPWPKTRHRKRRFVTAANLERIVRVLRPDGAFRFASDVDAYVKWTLREVAGNPHLVWTADTVQACREPWADWPGTRYEEKARAEGRRATYLTFRRG